MTLFYFSFVDKSEVFQGACLIEAAHVVAAMEKLKQLGVIPGGAGEFAAIDLGPILIAAEDSESDEDRRMVALHRDPANHNRLMSLDELEHTFGEQVRMMDGSPVRPVN